jgi:hypothetical protein
VLWCGLSRETIDARYQRFLNRGESLTTNPGRRVRIDVSQIGQQASAGKMFLKIVPDLPIKFGRSFAELTCGLIFCTRDRRPHPLRA